MKEDVLHKLIGITLLFVIAVTAICGCVIYKVATKDESSVIRQYIVDLNEIEQLIKISSSDDSEYNGDTEYSGDSEHNGDIEYNEELNNKIEALQDKLRDNENTSNKTYIISIVVIVYIVSLLGIVSAFIYIYIKIIRPFTKLEQYAGDIAKGNFDVQLDYERDNYFGAFTWAFDHMRGEIVKARAGEAEAIENNKTVIATLSHDIKTPIASIKTYSEAMVAGLDNSIEKRERYASVILRKCDEVTKLTDDLFLHSIKDMNMLMINYDNYDAIKLTREYILDIGGESGEIKLSIAATEAFVNMDDKRFLQVFENLINNSRKYAVDDAKLYFSNKLEINISEKIEDKYLVIDVWDNGPGIDDNDLPFIFNKFYRGHNAGSRNGAGLGLYIVKYIVEQFGGDISAYNAKPGFGVVIKLPLVEK